MTEPRTAAGRALSDMVSGEEREQFRVSVRSAILAIEAEARRDALTALRDQVERLPYGLGYADGVSDLDRASVLRAIDAAIAEAPNGR